MIIVPIIMYGGAGSRLWSKSRAAQPQQFLRLEEARLILAATAHRPNDAGTALETEATVIICDNGHEALVTAQMANAGFPEVPIIVEPFRRNTAAVAAVASLTASEQAPDSLELLLPADDHYIADVPAF